MRVYRQRMFVSKNLYRKYLQAIERRSFERFHRVKRSLCDAYLNGLAFPCYFPGPVTLSSYHVKPPLSLVISQSPHPNPTSSLSFLSQVEDRNKHRCCRKHQLLT